MEKPALIVVISCFHSDWFMHVATNCNINMSETQWLDFFQDYTNSPHCDIVPATAKTAINQRQRFTNRRHSSHKTFAWVAVSKLALFIFLSFFRSFFFIDSNFTDSSLGFTFFILTPSFIASITQIQKNSFCSFFKQLQTHFMSTAYDIKNPNHTKK